jgi:hypothetical protein
MSLAETEENFESFLCVAASNRVSGVCEQKNSDLTVRLTQCFLESWQTFVGVSNQRLSELHRDGLKGATKFEAKI